MGTLRQNDHTGFTNKGAPLTNDEVDANWTFLYDLIYANQEAVGAIHTQNTDQYLDQGGANEVSAADLAALVYEADQHPLHTQNSDTILNEGGTYEVTAEQLRALVDQNSFGVQEIQASSDTDGSGKIVVRSNDGAFTVTFRIADLTPGRSYLVSDIDVNATTNNITIQAPGGKTVDGGNSIQITTDGGYADMIVNSDGNLETLPNSVLS